ncbi:hypothetical protein CF65_00845 [Aggregatibacter actinomycetemcomitans HK1651]|nr:hypothetical protein CF65_00845 [Aggregatibacter actinomycetemcomitans HK1651]
MFGFTAEPLLEEVFVVFFGFKGFTDLLNFTIFITFSFTQE